MKTSDGYIFGGYNPESWISDFVYTETTESYLFSVTDGKGRKPIKCPVRPSRAHFAIKQNGSKYSPGFGEANMSDLFIAYKNLQNSYSNLGNVYKVPKQYCKTNDQFLAGSKKGWDIEEVEVWQVR